jgi:hypothetical protein
MPDQTFTRSRRLLTLAGLGLGLMAAVMLSQRGAREDQLRVDGGWETGEGGERFIAGTVTNATRQPYAHLHLSLSLLDSAGNVVGHAFATTQGLAAGERWEFRAPVTVEAAVGFRVESLSSVGEEPEP